MTFLSFEANFSNIKKIFTVSSIFQTQNMTKINIFQILYFKLNYSNHHAVVVTG